MPTPARGPRLGGSPAHERLLLANLATALFKHGRITTTVTKAKRVRPLAERLVTFAKRGDLHARRQVLTVVRDKAVVHRLFAEIGPRYAARPGGYTRITRLGPRLGDSAPMASIELVEALTVAQQAVGEGERARGTRFARDRRGGRTAVPAEAGETEVPAAAGDAPHQVAVPTEGGDTEVVTEGGEGGVDEAEDTSHLEEDVRELATETEPFSEVDLPEIEAAQDQPSAELRQSPEDIEPPADEPEERA